ncbi:hypothetical protein OPT61_g4398 [Boeremia exigua]|uniref:Uncharacterized protein n=1 Tax=Boeremia exigua TaxID=749465 RepID=A0ACC2IE50_9PLEO|nr:hypothetical protein OPT61_g4398 [Boeremia exigua]
MQYEVANSRALGSLSGFDTGSPTDIEMTSMAAGDLSPLSPRSTGLLNTSRGEKVYGTFCRTKSVVKRTLRRGKGSARTGSRGSLHSGYYSASTERLISKKDGEELGGPQSSTVSNRPPQISPLRPVSKFLPRLTISIPANDIRCSLIAEHHSVEDQSDDEGVGGEHDNLCVAPLRLHSLSPDSNISPGTSKANDDALPSPDERQTKRPMTKSMVKLRDRVKPDQKSKTSTTRSATGSLLVVPYPTPKLRHTALNSSCGPDMASLRSQFSASEPVSDAPRLDIPGMWTPDEPEMKDTVRVTPSLERGLFADVFQIYEANAVAAVAPVVRGVKPDVVDIQRPQMAETYGLPSRNDMDRALVPLGLSYHLPSGTTLRAAPETARSVLVSTTTPERSLTAGLKTGTSAVIPTLPFQILETLSSLLHMEMMNAEP